MQAVGIEGTSSYGVGIATAVTRAGIRVVEVNRTRPAERRKQGKSDRLDAYRAARSVLSGETSTDPKWASIEPLRALTVTRRSAVKAQQAAWHQIRTPSITITRRPPPGPKWTGSGPTGTHSRADRFLRGCGRRPCGVR